MIATTAKLAGNSQSVPSPASELTNIFRSKQVGSVFFCQKFDSFLSELQGEQMIGPRHASWCHEVVQLTKSPSLREGGRTQ